MSVTFKSHTEVLNRILASAARRSIEQYAQRVVGIARATSGSTAINRGLRYTVSGSGGNLSARVGSNATDARVVEEGAHSVTVYPKKGRYMKFPGTNSFAGTIVFAKKVTRPAVPARHYLKYALRSARR